jgi:hypothetical protein
MSHVDLRFISHPLGRKEEVRAIVPKTGMIIPDMGTKQLARTGRRRGVT